MTEFWKSLAKVIVKVWNNQDYNTTLAEQELSHVNKEAVEIYLIQLYVKASTA